MRIWGIILLILCGINLIAGFINFMEWPEKAISVICTGIGLGLAGYYLLSRAKKKDEEDQDRNKWLNGN